VTAAVFAAALVPSAVSAGVGPTFACDPGFYQVIAGQLAKLSPGTALYDEIGPDYANYNAMGYRLADGYLYAISSDRLYRIDADGARTELAQLDVPAGAYTGDFGDDGLLHISRGGNDWYAVNVDTFEATPIPELSAHKAVADITNVHGKFYGVSSNGILYVYDPMALTVTPGGTVGGLPATAKAYGAAWSTAGGNLYVGRNSGEIYQITGYSTGSPVATKVGEAPPTSSNDGASCGLAPVPAGLNDVDGPEPETEPSTAEAQAAADAYTLSFEVLAETFVVADPVIAEDVQPALTGLSPVVESPAEPTLEPVVDAGIGQGAACEQSLAYDRAERAPIDSFVTVEAPTSLLDSTFNADTISRFSILSGNWSMHDGAFNQLNACGFDYTTLLTSHRVDNFRWEATFSALSGDNQGGVLVNQSAADTRSGATVVDLAEGGSRLRWGSYNEAGYYLYGGSVEVTRPETGQSVTLAVEVLDVDVRIFFNGELVGETTAISVGGHVGLVASETDIAFERVVLTALPAPQPEPTVTPDPVAEPATTPTESTVEVEPVADAEGEPVADSGPTAEPDPSAA